MKLIKIDIIENSTVIKFNNIRYTTVKLTLKKWYGKIIEVVAYPTDRGPTFGGDSILYLEYCDSLGHNIDNEYEYGLSESISNYLLTKTYNI